TLVARFVNQRLSPARDILGIKEPKVNLNETARPGPGDRCSIATKAAEIIYILASISASPVQDRRAVAVVQIVRRGIGQRITAVKRAGKWLARVTAIVPSPSVVPIRSEEHTSELQSRSDLVCRLLLEKKKKK